MWTGLGAGVDWARGGCGLGQAFVSESTDSSVS